MFKQKKNNNNNNKEMTNSKTNCEICNKMFFTKNMNRHFKSKNHLKNVQKQDVAETKQDVAETKQDVAETKQDVEEKPKMRVLELFSGTHSVGVVCKELNYHVVSLDRDLGATSKIYKNYKSPHHIKQDIMTWDYKNDFDVGYFDVITASPVCCLWSVLRNCWIGRTFKNSDEIITKETLERDIDEFGKPMVDKVFEIIEYFEPRWFWVENPKSSKMWEYIKQTRYYDSYMFKHFDYCKYSDFGYKKSTIFLTNIRIQKPKVCNNDCDNMDTEKKTKHKASVCNRGQFINKNGETVICDTKEKRRIARENGWKHKKNVSRANNRLERYRIPLPLIRELFAEINKIEEECKNNAESRINEEKLRYLHKDLARRYKELEEKGCGRRVW